MGWKRSKNVKIAGNLEEIIVLEAKDAVNHSELFINVFLNLVNRNEVLKRV